MATYTNPHPHVVDVDGRPVPHGGEVDTTKRNAELLGLVEAAEPKPKSRKAEEDTR